MQDFNEINGLKGTDLKGRIINTRRGHHRFGRKGIFARGVGGSTWGTTVSYRELGGGDGDAGHRRTEKQF